MNSVFMVYGLLDIVSTFSMSFEIMNINECLVELILMYFVLCVCIIKCCFHDLC